MGNAKDCPREKTEKNVKSGLYYLSKVGEEQREVEAALPVVVANL